MSPRKCSEIALSVMGIAADELPADVLSIMGIAADELTNHQMYCKS